MYKNKKTILLIKVAHKDNYNGSIKMWTNAFQNTTLLGLLLKLYLPLQIIKLIIKIIFVRC